MEKVKVTQEQADLIKSIKDTDYAINIHGLNKRPDSPLRELTTAELARALYIGYVVESKFKVEDWVVYIHTEAIFRIIDVRKKNGDTFITVDDELYKQVSPKHFRHATLDEIEEEKERRWWNKHGRDVWELKKGDVIGINIKTITINEVREDGYIAYFDGLGSDRIYSIDSLKSGGYKIICFAEDRKDA